MPKTRFQILEETLAPYEGKVLSLDNLRLLLMRNLGTSGQSIINLMRFAQETGLTHEVEPFRFLIKKIEVKTE